MAASKVVAVRSALVAALALEGDLIDVDVSYAWTFGSQSRERIFTGRARATHDSASLKAGRDFRNERMTFDLTVLVEGVGLNPEETDERAMALGLVVEEYVADNKGGLGVDGVNWIRVAGMELQNMSNDRGSLSELTYAITYDARLT